MVEPCDRLGVVRFRRQRDRLRWCRKLDGLFRGLFWDGKQSIPLFEGVESPGLCDWAGSNWHLLDFGGGSMKEGAERLRVKIEIDVHLSHGVLFGGLFLDICFWCLSGPILVLGKRATC